MTGRDTFCEERTLLPSAPSLMRAACARAFLLVLCLVLYAQYAMHKTGLARPIFVLVACALTSASIAAMAAGAPLHWLYLLSLTCGLGFGGHWSAIPAVASDLYGLGSFAGIYSVLQLAPAVG